MVTSCEATVDAVVGVVEEMILGGDVIVADVFGTSVVPEDSTTGRMSNARAELRSILSSRRTLETSWPLMRRRTKHGSPPDG